MTFGQQPVPKSQRPDNLPLYFHQVHDNQPTGSYDDFWTDDYRQLVVVDIGYENFCLRIERRYYQPRRIEVMVFDKIKLPIGYNQNNFQVLFQELERFLQQYHHQYLQSHVIVIEWQLHHHYLAVRISTFTLSYFYFTVKNTQRLPLVVEMRSEFKNDYFPVLKPLNQNARKKKCVELAIQLARLAGDTDSLEVMQVHRKTPVKRDDYADTILMAEVFCRYAADQGWRFPHYRDVKIIKVQRSFLKNKDDLRVRTLSSEN